MSTDYDAPRGAVVDDVDSLEELKAGRANAKAAVVDVDEADLAERFELAGADLGDSADELTVRVVPMQSDEFRCARCFLVHHRSQLAGTRAGEDTCRECAA